MSDQSGTTVWVYDTRGRVVTETRTITPTLTGPLGVYTTTYGYDAMDRVTSILYPTGEAVTQSYNAAGQLLSVAGTSTYASNLAYDAAGRLTSLPLGSGLTTTYNYNAWTTQGGRLLNLTTNYGVQNLQYAYDPVGNVRTITDTVNGNQVQAFEYDALDRLTSAYTNPNGDGLYNERYGYDATGNLTLKVRDGITQTLNYTNTQHVHAVTGLDGVGRFKYDANGNMTQRVELSGTVPITYTQGWDAENRLEVVTNTVTGDVTRFVYDGDGNRVVQVRPDGSKIVYPGSLLEIELPAAAAPPAGTLTVTKFTDSNDGACNADCSLREAIRAANANSNADTIVLSAGTYTLTVGTGDDTAAAGDLDITQPLTLIGAGAYLTVLAMANTDRVMHILNTTVTLNGLKLTGGSGSGSGSGLLIQNSTVTVLNSAVSGNTGANATAGIYASSNSTLTLTNSAVLSNTVTGTGNTNGGGMRLDGGRATLTNVTFSGNSTNGHGGALYTGNSVVVTMTNVTVSNNTADTPPDGTGDGGGAYLGSTTTVYVKNVILAGNTDASTSGNVRHDCSGTLNSQGYNHIQSTTGCTISGTTTGNQTGTSAQLNALGNNGGPTLTHASQPGSPVINAGTNTGCPAQDQRGPQRMPPHCVLPAKRRSG